MAANKIFVFAAVTFLSACQNNKSIISVSYEDGGNLQEGDKVLLEGIAVGEVSKFHFVPKKVFIDLSMEQGVKIPLNSQFVVNKSLLGSTCIIIKPSHETAFISNMDTVMGVSYKEPVIDSVKQRKMQAGVQKIIQGLSEVLHAADTDSMSSVKESNKPF
ncbi:MlaD family protein [Hymenobacter convexus]|uniref:MlaD family protein n=1 Tax=Hymenobacter sp. CA1UV-4 TaxID=3063782 RepID=UPI0027122EA7|nr:MlaD family protein [Hymenobacter sp. CA1UV-4]MDO7851885.1 MlaD family protein [Hymenobacter sp. CA1UV-4]